MRSRSVRGGADGVSCFLRSTKCRHSFSGAAIKEIIQLAKGTTKCPVAGCPATLTLADLQEDPQLKTRVEQHKRRLKEAKETGGGSYKRTQTQQNYHSIDDSDDDED